MSICVAVEIGQNQINFGAFKEESSGPPSYWAHQESVPPDRDPLDNLSGAISRFLVLSGLILNEFDMAVVSSGMGVSFKNWDPNKLVKACRSFGKAMVDYLGEDGRSHPIEQLLFDPNSYPNFICTGVFGGTYLAMRLMSNEVDDVAFVDCSNPMTMSLQVNPQVDYRDAFRRAKYCRLYQVGWNSSFLDAAGVAGPLLGNTLGVGHLWYLTMNLGTSQINAMTLEQLRKLMGNVATPDAVLKQMGEALYACATVRLSRKLQDSVTRDQKVLLVGEGTPLAYDALIKAGSLPKNIFAPSLPDGPPPMRWSVFGLALYVWEQILICQGPVLQRGPLTVPGRRA